MVSSIYKCLDSFLPDEVVIEEEAVIRNVQTTRLLVRLQGAIQGWCISHCVKCTFIRPSQWRSKVGIKTGRKKRAELKQEAINLIQENLKLNVNDDIAESILIGFAAINKDIKEKKHGEN